MKTTIENTIKNAQIEAKGKKGSGGKKMVAKRVCFMTEKNSYYDHQEKG